MKRTEPTAYLAPTKGQQRLAYVPAAATDLRARFEAMRLVAIVEQERSKSAASRLAVIGRKA